MRQSWSMVLQERCKGASSVCESVGLSPDFNRPGSPQVGMQSDQMEEHLGRYCKAWKIPGLVPWCPQAPQHGWMSVGSGWMGSDLSPQGLIPMGTPEEDVSGTSGKSPACTSHSYPWKAVPNLFLEIQLLISLKHMNASYCESEEPPYQAEILSAQPSQCLAGESSMV